ncbi:hypothetical protein ETU10_07295 [Apibacter muscae]|uniref:hypothetical protein n=1 Tax=Apibacter muscae TaxID=2509004 RepID=UPI0011ADA492|nr:hypothetical protein [Apibacter muscae]TWP23521.1 hypothetical protein ETU10_07295 [Apibacter muscae]
MAKEAEKKRAYDYYVNQGKTAKETAGLSGVTEKTIGEWIKKGNWKGLRHTKANSKAERLTNIQQIIDSLAEDRIQVQRDISSELEKEEPNKTYINDLRRQAVSISDEISKWNKTLTNFDKENKISLSVYIEVMNDIFDNLKKYDPKIFASTVDFQEEHLNTISIKY